MTRIVIRNPDAPEEATASGNVLSTIHQRLDRARIPAMRDESSISETAVMLAFASELNLAQKSKVMEAVHLSLSATYAVVDIKDVSGIIGKPNSYEVQLQHLKNGVRQGLIATAADDKIPKALADEAKKAVEKVLCRKGNFKGKTFKGSRTPGIYVLNQNRRGRPEVYFSIHVGAAGENTTYSLMSVVEADTTESVCGEIEGKELASVISKFVQAHNKGVTARIKSRYEELEKELMPLKSALIG